jgi:hypothetical protein
MIIMNEIMPEVQQDEVKFDEATVAENPRQAKEIFIETLPEAYGKYTKALEIDRRSTDSEVRFVWGEVNPGLSAKGMFENAMKHLIEAEGLRKKQQGLMAEGKDLNDLEKSTLSGTNNHLKSNFGPEGTAAEEALKNMREGVRNSIEWGAKPEELLQIFRVVSSELE